MYMFQCYSLSLSHPLLLPLCLQVCSLCQHLYSCPANRFINTIFFLDSIYTWGILDWGFRERELWRLRYTVSSISQLESLWEIQQICWLRDCRVSIGEGNGNPLQYSCLENPTDRGAWWARVQRVVELDLIN